MALAEHYQYFRWDEASFIKAWEHGVFGGDRYELVDGDVYRVSIGPWHGDVTMNLGRLLHRDGWKVTAATLPAAGSLPDPDAWVRRLEAKPIARLGETRHIARWNPSDVALVVEVSDSSWWMDTETKAVLYGRNGYPVYWVVRRTGVLVMTDPYESGYRSHVAFGVDDHVELPHVPGDTIAVAALLETGEEEPDLLDVVDV